MNLIIIIFLSIFFSRSLVVLGLPGIFNHAHYFIVLFAFLFYLRNIFKEKIDFKINILFFFFIIIISSIYNFVSIYNFIIYSLIILEPFLVIIIILSLKLKDNEIKRLTNVLILFAVINTLVAYIQYFILGYRVDYVQGIFLGLGTAAHTSAAFSATAALYIYFTNTNLTNLQKILLVIFLLSPTLLGSANQIILMFVVVISFYILYNLISQKKLKNFYFFLLWGLLVFLGYRFTLQTNLYANLMSGREIFDFIDAIIYKYKVFVFLNEDFDFLNYFIGLGPGHGTSRLSLMIPMYDFIAFSSSFITEKIISIGNESYLNHPITGSSILSLVFFASGLYSELGLLGAFTYLLIWIKINHYSKKDKMVFVLILIIIGLGSIYQWPEEPAFIIYISSFIALQLAKKQENLK